MKTITPTHIARLLCPALLLLSACTQNEAPDEATNTPVPLQISNVALQATADTRAASTVTSGSIGVFVADSYNYYELNQEYTYTSGEWKSNTPIRVGNTPLKLCAYHPYNTGLLGNSSSPWLKLTAQVYSEAQDLSFAKVSANTTVTAANPTATFAMERAYARFTLNIKRQSGYPKAKPCRITNITLDTDGELPSEANASLEVGTYTYTDGPKILSFAGLGTMETDGIKADETQSISLLLIPEDLNDKPTKVQLTIDNVVHSFTIAWWQLEKLSRGMNYQIAVNINETGVAVTSISLADWVTKDITGGTTTGKVPAPGYIVVGGLKVAKGNLMRTGAKGDWYLAPDQGYYTNNATGGDYFSWGIDDPTDISENESGTSMDAITAGCVKVLGAGWHVPSNTEINALIAAGSVLGTYASQRGSTSGEYFGVQSAPAADHQDDYVFLPHAGFRAGEGKVLASGQQGFYWGSDVAISQECYLLKFLSHDPGGWLSTSSRGLGHVIRCVASATP